MPSTVIRWTTPAVEIRWATPEELQEKIDALNPLFGAAKLTREEREPTE